MYHDIECSMRKELSAARIVSMAQEIFIGARGWMLIMMDPENHVICVDVGSGTVEIDMVPGQFPQLKRHQIVKRAPRHYIA